MFLPTTREEMQQRGWDCLDVIIVTGDTYIDSLSISFSGGAELTLKDIALDLSINPYTLLLKKTVRGEISVEVIDPRTLRPFDLDTVLASLRKTGRLLVVHESPTCCGAGAEIAAQVMHEAFSYLDAPIERVGAKDSPIPFAPVLEHYILPNDGDVADAARRTLGRGERQ